MAAETPSMTPGLSSYLTSLRKHSATAAVDHLVILLRRRQIYGARPCAIAATHLFLRVIAESKLKNSIELLDHVRAIGRQVQAASPHELVLGNIARRVLGLIREVNEAPADAGAGGDNANGVPKAGTIQPLDVLAGQVEHQPQASDGNLSIRDVKEDVLNGLREMLDELDQADEQIAGYALEHVIPGETILTYTSSLTVQKFLLNAAKKRKFTVIHVEGYPNEYRATHDTILNGKTQKEHDPQNDQNRLKSLTSAGLTVIMVPDSAVFAVMPQVSKVLLPIQIGFPNGGFIGAAGSSTISHAAKAHRVPVLALGPIYKFTPVYPYDPEALTELGNPSKLFEHAEDGLPEEVDVINPITDYVAPELVDLFITNIGGHAPSFIYRIVADNYRADDVDLDTTSRDHSLNAG